MSTSSNLTLRAPFAVTGATRMSGPVLLLATVIWSLGSLAAKGEERRAGLHAESAKNSVPSARDLLGSPAIAPLAKQPHAKIIVDPPLAEQLANGIAVIQYRIENLRVMPVFGPEALAISPRIGHIHVTVDDAPWVWGVWHGTNGGEMILGPFPPGPHKVLFELENPIHEPIARRVVQFDVPQRTDSTSKRTQSTRNTPEVVPSASLPPAKFLVEAPLPDELARGLVIIKYRTENVQLLPVYGPAAAFVLPRIGHVHITVDDAPWHWADATGQPVVVNGLPPGPHKIRIDLVDANHQPLAQEVVKFDIAPRSVANNKPKVSTFEFSCNGNLKRPPVGYRKWVQIGTPLALHEGEAQEFHAVYMDPLTFTHFEKTGQIRDGAIVVKEASGVGSRESAAGKGYFMGEMTGLQASIKDSSRFKDEPGQWGYFDFGNKYPLRDEASKKPVAACNKCHADNAKTDWVFSQYYPVLRGATPHTN